MSRHRNEATVFVTTVILTGVPGVALACPVCFGASDSPMATGVNAGIYVLLGVTFVVLAALGLAALRVARAQAAATASGPRGGVFPNAELCGVVSSDAAVPVVRPTTAKTPAAARRTC